MSIKNWPAEDRPREKLLRAGVTSLSDTELLALFLRTGSAGASAVDLARTWIDTAGGLANLLAMPFAEANKLSGMGPARFCELQGALELGRRYLASKLTRGVVLDSPEIVAQWLQLRLKAETVEVFFALSFDSQNQLLACDELARGSASFVPISVRQVADIAIRRGAKNMIVAHNHPSGARTPSQADIEGTRAIFSALALLEIALLDHFIIAEGAPVSLKALGLF
jgi:DNA repair protein RadC